MPKPRKSPRWSGEVRTMVREAGFDQPGELRFRALVALLQMRRRRQLKDPSAHLILNLVRKHEPELWTKVSQTRTAGGPTGRPRSDDRKLWLACAVAMEARGGGWGAVTKAINTVAERYHLSFDYVNDIYYSLRSTRDLKLSLALHEAKKVG